MKHIKLFENNISMQSMKNIIDEYYKLIKYIEPFVLEKYTELSLDDNYSPEEGDIPNFDDEPTLISAYNFHQSYGNGIGFHLQAFDREGNAYANYYILFKNDELEQWIKKCELKQTNKKYNL